ncbi:MAG TPA: hypothetical protein VLA80_14510 [Actinomycetota bacterium]|nr:hypothetical protein [Actinomycetota bacterium]
MGPGEVDRPLGDDPDRPLLGLGLRGVGRVVEAVVQPRVGVEAHVDDVDPDQAGVDHGVHGGLEEQEAAVLPAADADQLDLGRDVGGGVDHPHAALLVGQGLLTRDRPGRRLGGRRGLCGQRLTLALGRVAGAFGAGGQLAHGRLRAAQANTKMPAMKPGLADLTVAIPTCRFS